jgi:hypothetical protein
MVFHYDVSWHHYRIHQGGEDGWRPSELDSPFLGLYWLTVHFRNKFTEEQLEAEGKAGNFLDQILGAIWIAQAFGADCGGCTRYDEYNQKVERTGRKNAFVRGSEFIVLYYTVLTSFVFAFW